MASRCPLPGTGVGSSVCSLAGCPAPTWAKARHKTFNTPNSCFQMSVSEKQGLGQSPDSADQGLPSLQQHKALSKPSTSKSLPQVRSLPMHIPLRERVLCLLRSSTCSTT